MKSAIKITLVVLLFLFLSAHPEDKTNYTPNLEQQNDSLRAEVIKLMPVAKKLYNINNQ